MYTDGINEAMDAADEEFGMEAVRTLTCEGGDADAVRDRIVKAVLQHVGSAPPFDDMCLVVIERIGTPAVTRAAVTDTADAGAIEEALKGSDQPG
jgi:sigma-B regulation protein RsbU (phosphoserine phosphatase)